MENSNFHERRLQNFKFNLKFKKQIKYVLKALVKFNFIVYFTFFLSINSLVRLYYKRNNIELGNNFCPNKANIIDLVDNDVKGTLLLKFHF